jgi:hypothetical protein
VQQNRKVSWPWAGHQWGLPHGQYSIGHATPLSLERKSRVHDRETFSLDFGFHFCIHDGCDDDDDDDVVVVVVDVFDYYCKKVMYVLCTLYNRP